MSAGEMNVFALKKMVRPCLVAGAALGAGALSACAGAFDPEVDPTSPLAPRVQALVAANRSYPRWEDFPRAEAPPEPVQVATRVNTLRATGGALAGEVSRIEWTLGNAADFEREVASRVDAAQASPESIETTEQIEARAAALRERAKAPPPIDRPR